MLGDQFEDQERESAELIWRQHGGLGVLDLPENPFLSTRTGPSSSTARAASGSAGRRRRVEATSPTVTWSAFRRHGREQWGEPALGPFVLARTAYETALRSPELLAADPLGPAPAGLGV
ncbi:hypothetical protein ABT330_00495 [Streptomyces sp. NPDC000658]|uniref:hypothetical protein n=1 Tax=Streptomyces sp. NPDC000658 TaxID=3154266 RepID=UPI003333C028